MQNIIKTSITAEYFAGLFDGEGCIDVQRCYPKLGRKNALYIRPRIRMCMADSSQCLIPILQSKFGGNICRRKPQNANQQSSWSIEWLSQASMRSILGFVLPHLILKAEQAKLVLWWLNSMSGKTPQQAGYVGIDWARRKFVEELRAMKMDPQRLSERATQLIFESMRQSEHYGDIVRVGESTTPLVVSPTSLTCAA